MRVLSTRVKGYGPFEDEVTLDFTDFGKAVVAFSGINGSGKSHLAEIMLPAILYRKLPYYDDDLIQGHFSPDGGEAETIIEHAGHRYELLIRGAKDKTPSCFMKRDGKAVAGPLVGDYDAAVAKYFPPREVVLSSYFAAQNDVRGFFSAKPQARLKMFSEMAGLSEYDALIAAITKALKDNEKELKKTVDQDSEFRGIKNRIDTLAETIRSHRLVVCKAENDLIAAELKLTDEEERVAKAVRSLDLLFGKRDSIQARHDSLNDLIDQINHETRRWKEVRGATETKINSGSDYTQLCEKLSSHSAKADASFQGLKEETRQQLGDTWLRVEAQSSGFVRYLQQLRDINKQLAREKQKLTGVDFSIEMCRRCPLTRTYDELLHEFGQYKVPFEVPHPAPVALQKIQSLLLTWRGAWYRFNAAVSVVNIVSYDHRVAASSRDMRAQADGKLLTLSNDRIVAGIERAWVGIASGILQQEIQDFGFTDKSPSLRETVANLKTILAQKTRELNLAEGELQGTVLDVEAYRTVQERRTYLVQVLDDDSTILNAARDSRRERVSVICPRVQKTCNTMLGFYQNGRFSIILPTEAENGTGGFKESFDPIILDSHSGVRKQPSGGESAVISEALRTAFAIELARSYGETGGTLIRDEVISHVDDRNVVCYMDILRYAITTGVFEQIFYVCHHKAILDQADVNIHLDNGLLVDIIR